jgi:hypothetical protein
MGIVLPDSKGSEGNEVLDSRICGIALGASLPDVAAATGMINIIVSLFSLLESMQH